jgi:predicted MPP superfamily phosphohydrolase
MRFALFFLLYGVVQIYCANKTIRGMGFTGLGRWLVYAWALAMTAGPFLLWHLERCAECQQTAVISAWVVYGWMGYSFLFFSSGLALDLYSGLARLGHLPRPEAATAFIILTLISVGLWVMGFHATWEPRVEHVVVESRKIPAKADGLRIVQISDMHLGLLIGRQRLAIIMIQVTDLNPDILVSTGDLVDAQAHHLDGLSSLFAAYKPRFGKYAITGNHEGYVGLAHALEFHERAGFKVLRGESVDVAGVILAGIDDPAVHRPDLSGETSEVPPKLDEKALLERIDPNRFVILLKHQPRVEPLARYDLQLSGHTHAGQIYPFRYLVRLAHPMLEGLHTLSNGARVYISRGTGTWGPPIRVFAPPEITLIELKRR